MKLPEPRRLPSGSWFVRVQVNGKSYSITTPTKKACIAEAMAIKSGAKKGQESDILTLTKAIDQYIEKRQNILSPSTIAGYRRIQKQRFKTAMKYNIFKTTQDEWQRTVNLESKIVKPKTVKNAWCFIAGVIQEHTGIRITVSLPQKVDNKMGFLDYDEIPKFLEAIKGDKAEIPALLAISSLRQSEILGLRWDAVDLEKGVIHIRETAVRDESGNLIRKATTKNSASRRTIPMIAPLREALQSATRSGDYVVTLKENTIRRHYKAACERAGVPYVRAHGLRHSFASLCHHLNVDEMTAMKIGGWADLGTMKGIYTHLTEADIAKRGKQFTSFFDPPKEKNCNENCNADSDPLEPQAV